MGEKQYRVIPRREIEASIAEGRSIFILDQYVIKADPWMPYHPGGDKAIRHMVGRDATDEVTALHSPETKQMMSRYRIGKIEGRWVNFVSPIQGGKFRPMPAEGEVEEEDITADDSVQCPSASATASTNASRDASPIFDSEDSVVRNRRTGEGLSRSTSVSSASGAEGSDGMAHLDVLTREKISLDHDKYPALDGATQDAIVQKYRLLHERIKAEKLYDCNYWAYGVECCRYVTLFGLSMFCLSRGWYAVSGLFMGAMWHQLVFTAHDAGHNGITHNYTIDTLIGIIIADFIGGLSIGWWRRNHNTHHIVTNSPEHDPDIQHMPFLAISHRFLQNLRSSYYDRAMTYDPFAKFMLRIQPYSYYVLMLFGRFNLYALSWEYLLTGQAPKRGPAWWHRWLELAGQAFFWTWYGYGILYCTIPDNWSRFVFLIISHMAQAPLHVQITLSHFAMSTTELGPHESFPQKMLRTTMDVDCPTWLDFFHGGLQFQAIHHLYPRIPRHNLRRTQKMVQEFCEEVGIPYALYGFVNGNKQVIGTFAEVSQQAAILAKCQRVLAASEDPLHTH